MVSSQVQKPQVQKPHCPVCQQADQVMKLPAAYESGMERFAPPPMPVARIRMMGYILVGFALVIGGVFFIFIWAGSGAFESWSLAVQIIQVTLTILAIVAALVLSFIAFLRVVQGDLRTQKYLPAWDRAMENWRRLYYCKRDNVVFDPKANKVVSDAALKALLAVEVPAEEVTAQPAQSAQSARSAQH